MTKQLEENMKQALARREKHRQNFEIKREKWAVERLKHEAEKVKRLQERVEHWSFMYNNATSRMDEQHAWIFQMGMDMADAIINGDKKRMHGVRQEMSGYPLYLNLYYEE
tara:strand:- start:114 stop:443 length:330 start_codon:yes stop_codon:yes gene_type:complete